MCCVKWRIIDDNMASQTWPHVRTKFEGSLRVEIASEAQIGELTILRALCYK